MGGAGGRCDYFWTGGGYPQKMVIFSFLECTQVDPLPSTLPGALPGAGCAAPYGVRHPSRGAPPLPGCAPFSNRYSAR